MSFWWALIDAYKILICFKNFDPEYFIPSFFWEEDLIYSERISGPFF